MRKMNNRSEYEIQFTLYLVVRILKTMSRTVVKSDQTRILRDLFVTETFTHFTLSRFPHLSLGLA